MKILVTGVNGQLGYDVVLELLRRGHEIIGTDVVLPDLDFLSNKRVSPLASQLTLLTLDITDKSAVHRVLCGSDIAPKNPLCPSSRAEGRAEPASLTCNDFRNESRNGSRNAFSLPVREAASQPTIPVSESANPPIRPFDVIIHCAAYTAVDAAEDNIERCRAVNVEGTRNIAEACAEIGAKIIYISTDYVFSGEGTEPWKADCRDFAPQNVYGRSKLDGEFAVAENLEKFFIVRTAWVFGNHGNNFVKTMLKVGATHNEVRVVNDQIGTPTYTPDLARLLCDMAESDKYGYYHATNEGGFISWYDFTCEIYRKAGYNTKVTPVSTAEYGLSRAKRPNSSRLDKSKLEEKGFERLPSWQDALERYLARRNSCGTVDN